MTITIEQQNKIRKFLKTHHIPAGLGTKENACSIAAINLCLTGELTEVIPDCMSHVIGIWIIRTQDRMPDSIRNSDKWKELLPLAAGTGRKHEKKRLEIIMRWMWNELSTIQHIADTCGFGKEWTEMTTNKDSEYARRAKNAADAADAAYPAAAAAYAAYVAVADADAAADAVDAVAVAADAAAYAAYAAAAADAAAYAAYAAGAAAYDAAYWIKCDPCGLLKKLILVNDLLNQEQLQQLITIKNSVKY